MQETNLYTITIPPMITSLTALSKMLDRAEKHAAKMQQSWMPKGSQETSLLNDNLIFDQFPLIRQVQISCDNAKGCAARLSGVKNPVQKDSEKTIKQLQQRIEKTITFMKKIKPAQVIGKEGEHISLAYWQGKHMTGFEYVTTYALPNFYFHVTTAYSILRKNGIEIGKYDYLIDLPLKTK